MKRIGFILLLLLINVGFILNVNAAGGITVSRSSISLEKGGSTSF